MNTSVLSIDKITEIFCIIDDFCNEFDTVIKGHGLGEKKASKSRNRAFVMSDSEVITILILFHSMGYKNLKHFYTQYVQIHLKNEFPHTVSYNRFVELQKKVTVIMVLFLKMRALGACTGVSFIDSTRLEVCHAKRERSNKTFKGIATKGKSTMGWFFGFKLHLIINDRGELLDFLITQGHVDDREPLKEDNFHKRVLGKLIGDKGYISQSLFERLFIDGVHLITKIRKNMKNSLMHIYDKLLLRKRALIESVNDELKNMCQIEHTRHRSFENFINNLISGLIAYSFFPKKPSINTDFFTGKAKETDVRVNC